MSLVISLALDLPKFITREPPPCIWFMMNRKIRTMMTIGRKLTSRLTQEVLLRHLDGVAAGRACRSVGAACSCLRAAAPWPATQRGVSTRFAVRSSGQLDALVLVDDLGVADLALLDPLMTLEVSAFSKLPLAAPQSGDEQEQHNDAQDPQQWPTCKSLEIHPMRNPGGPVPS